MHTVWAIRRVLSFSLYILYVFTCGFRCKKIFDSDIKQTPVTAGDSKTIAAQKQQIAMNAIMQSDKQKKELEMVQKRHQMNAEIMK